MASYDRRITLYINGQQISNDVKSIRAEMTRLINEQARMTIGSREYIAAASNIRNLRGILAQHQQQIAAVGNSWSFRGMADGINRYFGLITAGIASLTGVVMGFKSLVKTFNDFEERVGNLSALTGLAGKSLDWLSQKAKDLSTSTLEGGIRVRQTAQDIVDAFTKVGSARPELLKNKEALVDVTENAIILANAAKTELQPAIEGLTMVLNQYNVPASESRRIINAMAAGSKEGAGEIPYITQAFEKAGTVAADANIPIETLIATIETLAPRITQPEIAGRTLKATLIALQQGADDTNPAIVGMTTAFENLAKKNLSVTELTKLFGLENVTTAKILINNVGELKKYETAVTGTNVAIEQAIINTDNNNSKLDQAKNRINVVSIELGEKLAPSLTLVTGWFGKTLTVVSALVDVFIKYGPTIITATAAIIGYTVATKLAVMWTNRNNASSLISIVISKAQALAFNAQFAALALYNAATALLSGNLKVAAIQFRAFSAAMAANPIGLIVGLLIAAGTALYFYTAKLTDVQIAQKAINDVNLEASKNIVEEKIKMGTLIDIAKNENRSKLERLNAIRQLNAISPQYLGNLTLETIGTDKAKKSIKEYTDSLFENAKVMAAQQKIIEIEKQRLDDLASGANYDTSIWQKMGAGIMSGGSAIKYTMLLGAKATDNAVASNDTYLKSLKSLNDIVNSDQGSGTDVPGLKGRNNEIKGTQDLIKLKEQELEAAKLMPGATIAEIALRNKKVESIQREINKLNELGTTKEGKEDKKKNKVDNKDKLEAIEADNKNEIDAINKKHLVTKNSESQYNAELLAQEFNFLQKKRDLYEVGSKEYEEINAQISDKQVKASEQVKNLLLQAEKELKDAKIENLKDGIEKEKAIENQRWDEELIDLKKRRSDITGTSTEEIALKDAINKIIEQKTDAHNKKMKILNSADNIEKLEKTHAKTEDVLTAADDFATSTPWLDSGKIKSFFDARRDVLKTAYEEEQALAGDNQEKQKEAEKKYNDELSRIKRQEVDITYDAALRRIDIGQSFLGALAGMVDQESALGKAIFLFQQGLAISSIWISAAKANMKAVETLVLPPLYLPVIATNTNMALLNTALVVAQTVAGFVKPSGKKTKGHAEGGYTGDGGKYEEAGIVHKGEYVVTKEEVGSIGLQPLKSMIQMLKRNNTNTRLELNPAIQTMNRSGSYASGGFVLPSETSNYGSSTIINSDPELKALIKDLTNQIKGGIKASINKFGSNGIDESIRDITKFNAKIGRKS